MDEEVRKWEHKTALVAAENGLGLYKDIINQAKNFLKKNSNIPQIVLEIGERQGQEIKKLLLGASFTSISIEKDLVGKDRFATAKV